MVSGKICCNENSPVYHYYGGRGIIVCDRWLKFENFLADMGEPPKGKQLDRIDNDGNYELGNCRWTTHFEQCRNFRRNIWVTVGDETMILQDWADRLEIHEETLRNWYHKGIWPKDFYRRPQKRTSYGDRRGQFIPVPKELQLEGRKAAIARWTRKHPQEAKDRLLRGIIPEEDANVMRVALGIR